jgi:hypothetical protein
MRHEATGVRKNPDIFVLARASRLSAFFAPLSSFFFSPRPLKRRIEFASAFPSSPSNS